MSTIGQTYEVRVIDEKKTDPWANYTARIEKINEDAEQRRQRNAEQDYMNRSLYIQQERLQLERDRLRYDKYGY